MSSTSPTSPAAQAEVHTVRVWDLPTRLFHSLLALAVIALVVSAKIGGNAMVWHFRFGYAVLALLLFRLIWGVLGGHWSRFSQFVRGPGRIWAYLRGQGHPEDHAGHSPLAGLSVLALLGVVALQVFTGLFTDDEIFSAGPLTPFVSGTWVSRASWYHADIGQYLVYALIALHLLAIAFYVLVKKRRLITPMLHGDQAHPIPLPHARDDAQTRLMALVVLLVCSAAVWGGLKWVGA